MGTWLVSTFRQFSSFVRFSWIFSILFHYGYSISLILRLERRSQQLSQFFLLGRATEAAFHLDSTMHFRALIQKCKIKIYFLLLFCINQKFVVFLLKTIDFQFFMIQISSDSPKYSKRLRLRAHIKIPDSSNKIVYYATFKKYFDGGRANL